MRVESSIITSLSELKQIEQQRIAEERAAFDRERKAEADAKRAVEQARLDAEEARRREEHEARVRVEIARAEAEREGRLRVEASEAAERARHAAALDQERLINEMELRRAEVAKTRPTWMLAVTGIAFLAAIGLTWFAIDRSQRMAEADDARNRALQEARAAKEDSARSAKKLAELQTDVTRFGEEVEAAQKALAVAQNDADRKRARDAIAAANQRKADADRKFADWKRAEDKRIRDSGHHVDPKCLEAPIACLKR